MKKGEEKKYSRKLHGIMSCSGTLVMLVRLLALARCKNTYIEQQMIVFKQPQKCTENSAAWVAS